MQQLNIINIITVVQHLFLCLFRLLYLQAAKNYLLGFLLLVQCAFFWSHHKMSSCATSTFISLFLRYFLSGFCFVSDVKTNAWLIFLCLVLIQCLFWDCFLSMSSFSFILILTIPFFPSFPLLVYPLQKASEKGGVWHANAIKSRGPVPWHALVVHTNACCISVVEALDFMKCFCLWRQAYLWVIQHLIYLRWILMHWLTQVWFTAIIFCDFQYMLIFFSSLGSSPDSQRWGWV